MKPVNANESLLCLESKEDASFIKLSCRNSVQIMFNESFSSESEAFLPVILSDSPYLTVLFYTFLQVEGRVKMCGWRGL